MKPRVFPLFVAVLAMFVAGRPAFAAGEAPPAESRQFDFWIGEWTVTTPDGKHAGDNRIERIANGCALLENWSGARGNSGKSLNAWNREKKQWQQFWVDSDGGVLELAGGLDAQGRMVLSGESGPAGQRTTERITWTPQLDGSVRQVWEQSADGGATWRVVFDGRYVRKAPGGGGSGKVPAPLPMFW